MHLRAARFAARRQTAFHRRPRHTRRPSTPAGWSVQNEGLDGRKKKPSPQTPYTYKENLSLSREGKGEGEGKNARMERGKGRG